MKMTKRDFLIGLTSTICGSSLVGQAIASIPQDISLVYKGPMPFPSGVNAEKGWTYLVCNPKAKYMWTGNEISTVEQGDMLVWNGSSWDRLGKNLTGSQEEATKKYVLNLDTFAQKYKPTDTDLKVLNTMGSNINSISVPLPLNKVTVVNNDKIIALKGVLQ